MKVIQCPQCDSELTDKTGKVLGPHPGKSKTWKIQCVICRHKWVAREQNFYENDAVPQEAGSQAPAASH